VAPTGGTSVFASRTFIPPGGLSLTSGVQYAAVVRFGPVPSTDAVGFQATGTDPYAGGQMVACPTAMACNLSFSASFDAAFEARFVSAVAVVPVPLSVALLGMGLAVLGAPALRRRVLR
jgi:hypothetical protein